MVTDHPAVKTQLVNDDGRVRSHIIVFVNDEDIRRLDGEDTSLVARDEVWVITAMAGG